MFHHIHFLYTISIYKKHKKMQGNHFYDEAKEKIMSKMCNKMHTLALHKIYIYI